MEYGRIFHPNGRKFIDVEKPPVIDFIRSNTPMSEPIYLLAEELIQSIKALCVSLRSIENGDIFADEGLDRLALIHDAGKSPSDDLLFPIALFDPRRIQIVARGQMPKRSQYALILLHIRITHSYPTDELIQSKDEDQDRVFRINGQLVIAVTNHKPSFIVFESDFLLLHYGAILLA